MMFVGVSGIKFDVALSSWLMLVFGAIGYKFDVGGPGVKFNVGVSG